MKKKLKTLTPKELEIWNSFVLGISTTDYTASHSINRKELRSVQTIEKKQKKNNPLQAFGKSSNDPTLIDKKVYTKLKNGRLKPERILDLHGFNYNIAKETVEQFVAQAYHDEKRLILIITGKGRRSVANKNLFDDAHRGVLNGAFPIWLRSNSLKNLVLNVTLAHSSHGGSGAYYVYLRKKKL